MKQTEENPLSISRIAVVFFCRKEQKWWVDRTYVDNSAGLRNASDMATKIREDGLGFDGVVKIVRLSAIEEIPTNI